MTRTTSRTTSKRGTGARERDVARSIEAMGHLADDTGRLSARRWNIERPEGTMCADALRIHFGTWMAALDAALGPASRERPRTGAPIVRVDTVSRLILSEMDRHGVSNPHALADIVFADDAWEAQKAQQRWRTWIKGERIPRRATVARDLFALYQARAR